MIDFTEFYPDELLYSYLSRCYVRSGFITFKDMADYLYSRKSIRPEVRFTNILREEVRQQIGSIIPWEIIAEKHTMLPQYRFIAADRLKTAYELVYDGKTILNYTKNAKDNNHHLYYCPECAKGDRAAYGETYWHRNHQIDGLHICGKHGCFLQETEVSVISRGTPTLTPAEIVIPYAGPISYCETPAMLEFSQYCHEVFNAPLFLGEYPPVGDFLSYSLGERYLSKTGATRNIERLYKDFKIFEAGVTPDRDLTEEALHKIFTGKNWNFMDICGLAYFEQIPAELLTSPFEWEQHIPKNSIYTELAERFRLDYSTVKAIGEEVLKRYRTGKRIQRPCGRKDIQWSQLDEELLEPVEQACKEIYGDGSRRPGKVMAKTLQRKLELPQKQLEKLPKCSAEISRWKETYPEFWAREAVWAVHELKRTGQPVNWKHVRNLISLKKPDFYRCKDYISRYTDEREATFVKNLI